MITPEQFGELLDVLWEIKGELTEIRKSLSMSDARKKEEEMKIQRKRLGI